MFSGKVLCVILAADAFFLRLSIVFYRLFIYKYLVCKKPSHAFTVHGPNTCLSLSPSHLHNIHIKKKLKNICMACNADGFVLILNLDFQLVIYNF